MHTEFTTIATADILDGIVASVDAARIAAVGNRAWLAAIDTAYGHLLQQEVISFDLVALAIKVESATQPGVFYEANGKCSCAAATKGAGVCWHRAAARLVRRALAWNEADLAARNFSDEADEAYQQAYRAGQRGTVALALEWDEARELADLANELVAESHELGAFWYGQAEGHTGATWCMPRLRDFAAEWDQASAAQRDA